MNSREMIPTIRATTAPTMIIARSAAARGRNSPEAARPIATSTQIGLIGGWRRMRTSTGTRPYESRRSMASAASSGVASASVIWMYDWASAEASSASVSVWRPGSSLTAGCSSG
jgi:hypothetical protein